MATIYKCDKCHSEHNEPISKVELPLWRYNDYYNVESDTFTKDLCRDCIRKLNEFVKPDPIVKQG